MTFAWRVVGDRAHNGENPGAALASEGGERALRL